MKKRVFGLLGLLFLVTFTITAYGESATSQAIVKGIMGEAQFKKAGSAEWAPLTQTTVLHEGDTVKTSKDCMVKLELQGADKTGDILVKEDSEFTFKDFNHDDASQKETTRLNVKIGSILVKAEKLKGDSKFEVNTPTSIVGIRGTTFEVKVEPAS